VSITLPRLALALSTLALLIAGLASMPATSGARGDNSAQRARGDRNRDRIPDRWERRHRLNLRVNQARRDQDRDGLRNRDEFLAGTSPRDSDSDDDGIRDGHEGAGRIISFVDGVLTIEPFGTADAVRGRVDARTELTCDDDGPAVPRATSSSSDDERGDDSDRSSGDGEDGSGHDAADRSGQGDDRDGHDDGDRHDGDGRHGDEDDDHGPSCSVSAADVVPGAIVHEAKLEVRSGGAFWDEIELIRPRAAT